MTASDTQPLIRLRNVSKTYPHAAGDVRALRGVDLEVPKGEFLAILGPSGSGKSTLLHVIGTLDAPSGGTVEVGGVTLGDLPEAELLRLRRAVIGFVFQSACLVPSLTVAENVRLPRTFARRKDGVAPVEDLLRRVGLTERASHRPNQLSGGEQQRAAIARGLSNGPSILLADEPTGHLDSVTGAEIGALLTELNRDLGLTIVLATHDERLAALASRTIRLTDGRIVGARAGDSSTDASARSR